MSVARAQQMRKAMTPAEKAAWRVLRYDELGKLHFRRQAPFGPYVLDFVSHAARLVVEIDGSHHADAAQQEHDAKRTAYIEAQGYRVLRAWNHEATRNGDGLYLTVLAMAKETPAAARLAPIASPSMGEAARSAGGGARASAGAAAAKGSSLSASASPPQSSLRDDSSPIEGERGASGSECA